MAIKFGSNGTLYCNTVKYNYKQARNLVPDGCLCGDGSKWTLSNCSVQSTTTSSFMRSGSQARIYFNTNVTAMAQCPMPAPIANHKYYGACVYSTVSGYSTAGDARFEWFLYDGQNLVFGQKTADTEGLSTWVKLSAIQSLSSVQSGNWIIRNFVVNGTQSCYCTKMIIVDLTDTFGSGNEPSLAWCDENILEWSKFYRKPDTAVTSSNYSSIYTGSITKYDYCNLDASGHVRDYTYRLDGNTSSSEVFINSTVNISLTPTYTYYGFMDVQYPATSGWTNQSMDIYFPVAEPLLGNTALVDARNYNGGGGLNYWKRVSMMRDRSSFSSGSYAQRFDLNNKKVESYVYVTNLGIISNYSFYNVSRYFASAYGGWTEDSDYNNYTKPFMDRRYGGQNPSIIHIPNPANKTIKFNTNYDIVCNDIIPDPRNSKVWFDTNGRIHCKTIVTDQKY